MADSSPQQPASISARIASLKLTEVGRAPGVQPRSSLRPPPPAPLTKRPSLDLRSKTSYNPPQSHGSAHVRTIGNRPTGNDHDGPPPPYSRTVSANSIGAKPLLPPRPPRNDSLQSKPSLPPRRPSEQGSERRNSIDSQSSGVSITSSYSNSTTVTTARTTGSKTPSINGDTRTLAPAYDPSTLPVQFPAKLKEGEKEREKEKEKEKEKEQVKTPLKPTYPSPVVKKRVQPPTRSLPPPLPPPRPKSSAENRESLQAEPKPTPQGNWEMLPVPVDVPALPKRPSQSPAPPDNRKKLPPPMPKRSESSSIPQDTRRNLPPPFDAPIPKRSALSFAMNNHTEEAPPIPANRPDPAPTNGVTGGTPPPVPLASRPKMPPMRPAMRPPTTEGSCLKCRDFSGPDVHAARFPRQSIPSTSIHWIATQLTSPFPSLTDKARAIFTWLHHNIEYDCDAFFNNNVQHATPESTIRRGLAVCAGYAGLFTSLATVAGLESIVVSGHGKGFGHAPLAPGAAIPSFSSNHAWNAVKMDDGEWHLIDSCWGAGNVGGKNMPYQKHFKPMWFTMGNAEFGLKHFPTEKSQFFYPGGYAPTWEEYIVGDPGGEGPQIFGTAEDDCGILTSSFLPRHKRIDLAVSGPVVRFQFTTICDHWDSERMGKGKPPLLILQIQGRGGKVKDMLPFETNGRCWWLDVKREELGVPGQEIMCLRVETLDGRDAKGVSAQEYMRAKGKKAMGFSGVALWELA
ncbi:hypothetical protein FGG08_005724 [Glutinoglossum americanum]|uniref:Transglutaminase-like domain-containing protein n=1 Tax=Glutinoglossum americanum TaxID=1670608 RepID=A0A9P8KVS2_9PEZI|nr:hypothetical protein FGG08_005724 [Glutinoglossum americanum]